MLFLYDFNNKSRFESENPLERDEDYARSPISEAFKAKNTSHASTHYQILLNSQWFLDLITHCLNKKGPNLVKILSNLLDLGRYDNETTLYDNEPLYKKIKLEAFSVYAQAIIELYFIQYMREKKPELLSQEDHEMYLFKNFQMEAEIIEGDRATVRRRVLKDCALDLKDLKPDDQGYLTVPDFHREKIKTHGNIILLSNMDDKKITHDIRLKFNGRIFRLLGGQFLEERRTSPRDRFARVIKRTF